MNGANTDKIERYHVLKKLINLLGINVNHLKLAKYLELLKPSPYPKKCSLSIADICEHIHHKKEFIDLYKDIQKNLLGEEVDQVLSLIQHLFKEKDLRHFLEEKSYTNENCSSFKYYLQKSEDYLDFSFNPKLLVKHIKILDERKYQKLYLENLKTENIIKTNDPKTIIYDLIKCFQGYQGKSVTFDSNAFITTDLEVFIQEWCKRFYPLTKNFTFIACDIDKNLFTYDKGLVYNTFYTQLKQIVDNYFIFMTQIENILSNILFDKLWIYIQPVFYAFTILSDLITKLNKTKKRSCDLLNILYHSINIYPKHGDYLLLGQLFQEISQPYFDILNLWLGQGIIFDHSKEFFIKENTDYSSNILSDSYNKYLIVQSRIPLFLQSHYEMIYKTGKYINIINDFYHLKRLTLPGYTKTPDKAISISKALSANFRSLYPRDIDNDNLYGKIEMRYQAVNQFLFYVIVKNWNFSPPDATSFSVSTVVGAARSFNHRFCGGYGLYTLLRSVKNYFFVERGDFLLHFMDSAQEELQKSAAEILPFRLESLLDISLRTSSASIDVYKDHLMLSLCSEDLYTHLNSIMAVSFGPVIGGGSLVNPTETSTNTSSVTGTTTNSTRYCSKTNSPKSNSKKRYGGGIISSKKSQDNGQDDNDSLTNALGNLGLGSEPTRFPNLIKNPKNVDATLVENNSNEGPHGHRLKPGREKGIAGSCFGDEPLVSASAVNKDLMGADVINLDFRVDWPLNLVVMNAGILNKYQIIFRYLFMLHHTENGLSQLWQDVTIQYCALANAKNVRRRTSLVGYHGSFTTSITDSPFDVRIRRNLVNIISKHVCVLLNYMILFVQSLLYYLKYDVLEPQWMDFYVKIGGPSTSESHSSNFLSSKSGGSENAQQNTIGRESSMGDELTVDALYKSHMETLYNIINSSMLNDMNLFNQVHKIIKICDSFCKFINSKINSDIKTENWDNILMDNLTIGDRIRASQRLKQMICKSYEFRFKNNVCKLYAKLSNDDSSNITPNHNLIHYIYKLDCFLRVFSASLQSYS